MTKTKTVKPSKTAKTAKPAAPRSEAQITTAKREARNRAARDRRAAKKTPAVVVLETVVAPVVTPEVELVTVPPMGSPAHLDQVAAAFTPTADLTVDQLRAIGTAGFEAIKAANDAAVVSPHGVAGEVADGPLSPAIAAVTGKKVRKARTPRTPKVVAPKVERIPALAAVTKSGRRAAWSVHPVDFVQPAAKIGKNAAKYIRRAAPGTSEAAVEWMVAHARAAWHNAQLEQVPPSHVAA